MTVRISMQHEVLIRFEFADAEAGATLKKLFINSWVYRFE